MTAKLLALAALGALAASSCAAPKPPVTVMAESPLPATRVDQVVEQGDLAYLFGPDRITIARAGLATNVAALALPCGARCPERVWTSAASIPALDGDGRWIVATRYDQTLWRVTMSGELEQIGDRFRAGDGHIAAIGSAGALIAIAIANAIGVTTDGMHVARYAATGELAVARDRLAIATATGTELWDLAKQTRTTFAVTGHPAFLDAASPEPRLVVMQPDALWYARGGVLHKIGVPAPYAAAVAGALLWLRAGQLLYVLRDDALAPTNAKLKGKDGGVFGVPSGDVWVGDAGAVSRYTFAVKQEDLKWQVDVQDVFARVCAHCHLPGGSADIDLSTPATWTTERDELKRRVLVTKTMPPAGTPLSDDDRGKLAEWLNAK